MDNAPRAAHQQQDREMIYLWRRQRRQRRLWGRGWQHSAICGAFVAAWLTHVVASIMAGTWGLLIAGAIFPPIGVVNGIGIWLGVW